MRLSVNYFWTYKFLIAAALIAGFGSFQGRVWAAENSSNSKDAATPAEGTNRDGDLTNASLESLMGMDVVVTSSAKKAESLRDATSAIYVITQEDIHQSGVQHLPDLFRMVPGLLVSRVDGSQWAITARGFNSLYNNKMLVLVDGRSVYQSTFGGVNWDELDLILEDIERIEVIRGPGGTLWGSNAVNGVINIITKDSKITQGFYATGLVGSDTNNMGILRYGGVVGDDLYYRVYGKTVNQGPLGDSDNSSDSGQDNWTAQEAGFKVDLHGEKDLLTLQGDYQVGNFYLPGNTFNPSNLQTTTGVSDTVDRDDHFLTQWTHTFSDGSEGQIKTYYDQIDLRAPTDQNTILNTFDAEIQHRFLLGDGDEITWGMDFRNVTDNYNVPFGSYYNPEQASLNTYGAFLQNKLTLVGNRLYLTAGAKLENNPYTGDEWQPSGRLLWTPDATNSLWVAVSRTVRVPSRAEEGVAFYLGGQVAPGPTTFYTALLGNPHLKVEDILAYEFGYRTNLTSKLSLDLAAFYDRYYRIIGSGFTIYTAPPFPPTPLGGYYGAASTAFNADGGALYGAEFSLEWKATDSLKVSLAYTYNDYDQALNQASNVFNGNPPPHHIVDGRLAWNPWNDWQFNTSFYWVDETFINDPTTQSTGVVPAYEVWDLGATWKPSGNWEISVWGQDLEGTHAEASSFLNGSRPIPAVYGQLTVRY